MKKVSFYLLITKRWPPPIIAEMRLAVCRELTHVCLIFRKAVILRKEKVDFYLVYSTDSVSLSREHNSCALCDFVI